MGDAPAEADALEQFGRLRPPQAAAHAVRPRRHRGLDVLERGQRRDQVELLEDEADPVATQVGQLAVAHLGQRAALEDDASACGPVECAEQLQ